MVGSGVAAAPLAPFRPVTITTDALSMAGTGAGAAPVAFRPVTITTDGLSMIGAP